MNPLDVNYRKLRAQIAPLEKFRAEYKLIEQMIQNVLLSFPLVSLFFPLF